MQDKEKGKRAKKREKWFVYMIRCCDLSLYTGIAKDIEKRFKKHSEGKGARYTRSRRPLEIVYRETCRSRTEALVRECAVKAMPKPKKITLVEKYLSGES